MKIEFNNKLYKITGKVHKYIAGYPGKIVKLDKAEIHEATHLSDNGKWIWLKTYGLDSYGIEIETMREV